MPYIPHLVAIGTSAGGPLALQILFQGIPADVPASFLVVQHMLPGFTASLAKRLNDICSVHVVEAEDGQTLRVGTVYIAPGNYHMEIIQRLDGKLSLSLNQGPPLHGHRPAVDILFESLASIKHPSKHAVILTGMGKDGTAGLKKLREKGVQTVFAEDESTCAVFGMPRSAIQTGAVDHVVPIHKMANQLLRCLNR